MDPEKVKFKVLTCEWDTDELVPAKQQEPISGRVASAYKRQKTRGFSLTDSFRKMSIGDTPTPGAKLYSGLPVVFGDGGKSKFEFTMEIPFPTLHA